MHCVSCVTIGLIGFVSDSAPSSSHSSIASSYMDVPFYGSITLRMSTRRLSVMLFVFSFRVTVISYYLLRGVLWWPRSFLFTSARRRENCTTFHSLLLIILHRLHQPYRSRLYKGCFINCFSYNIICFIMSVCCPFSAGYRSGLAKVRRP